MPNGLRSPRWRGGAPTHPEWRGRIHSGAFEAMVAKPKLSASTSNPSNLNAVPDANGAAPPTTNSADRKRNVATVSRSARGRERDINQASSWRRNRTVDDEVAAASSWGFWQDRDADQRSSRAWDRAADDNVPTGRSSGRREDRDADQA